MKRGTGGGKGRAVHDCLLLPSLSRGELGTWHSCDNNMQQGCMRAHSSDYEAR